MGSLLRARPSEVFSGYEMVKGVEGLGLMNGIEFSPPRRMRLRVPFEVFRRIHPGMFGRVVVMRLFRDHRILTQMCGNNFMALKAAPPGVITHKQIEQFVGAVRDVVEQMHSSSSFWTEALGLARRVINV
ncbi:MAG: hypothetical protein IT167_08325 [Bryobacterales bacterium]|nr:hypothetical protein [Bryobacterales bacterium]